MDLYQQPQEQESIEGANNLILSYSAAVGYEKSLDQKNHPNLSPNTVKNIGQPSNSPDVLSAHLALPQQALDTNANGLTHSSKDKTTPLKALEDFSDSSSKMGITSSNSAGHLISSNVISSEQNDTQPSSSENQIHSRTIDQAFTNERMVLQQENMFNIHSPTNANINCPASFVYPECQAQQKPNQNTHIKNTVETRIESQTHSISQNSPEVYSHGQSPIRHSQITNHQSNLGHLIVPSQRMLSKPQPIVTRNQYDIEEQERVATAAQQVMAQRMAQQYAILKHLPSNNSPQPILPSQHSPMASTNNLVLNSPISPQDMQHVVLSQMPMLNSFQNSANMANLAPQKVDTSLHDAVLYHQHQKYQERLQESGTKRPTDDLRRERKKSRRHTVSNSNPSALKIGTANLSTLSSSPRSAIVLTQQNNPFVKSDILNNTPEQQKQTNEITNSTMLPFHQELKSGLSAPIVDIKDYNQLSRAQLISRLISLENEKLQNSENQNQKIFAALVEEEESNVSVDNTQVSNPYLLNESKPAADDEDDEDEDEGETELLEDQLKNQKTPCKWKDCTLEFDMLPDLIAHINNMHIGSGKPSYYCEWENCQRNEKPFTKRHKIFNHLRTHTGERPFICDAEGCGKKFSRPDSLSTHVKTHSNIRPYICRAKDCGKAYYHARSLKKHEKTHETATLVTHIQFPAATDSSFHAMPFSSPLSGSLDYMNIQLQSSSMMHTSNLTDSPQQTMAHPSIATLQPSSTTNNAYTPPHLLQFSPAGMVKQQQQNNTDAINQHQSLESVNQQCIYN